MDQDQNEGNVREQGGKGVVLTGGGQPDEGNDFGVEELTPPDAPQNSSDTQVKTDPGDS